MSPFDPPFSRPGDPGGVPAVGHGDDFATSSARRIEVYAAGIPTEPAAGQPNSDIAGIEGAGPRPASGSSASVDQSADQSAGSGSKSGPDGDLMAQALGVLDRALDELAGEHRQPTASLVRLTMKRLTYNGFDPKLLGFKRFRDFLEAAAHDKRIELHDRPGDLLVGRRGAAVPPPRTSVRIRRDLWKSTLDWSSDVSHYLDLETDKIVTLPKEAVPLEPGKFAELRDRVAGADDTLARIPSIDIRTQVGWMASFVDTVADREVQLLLEQALASPKSAREFARVLRSEPAVRNAWNSQLTAHVLVHLLRWKTEDPKLVDVQIEATETAAATGESAAESATQQSPGPVDPTSADSGVTSARREVAVDPSASSPARLAGQSGWRVQSGAAHIVPAHRERRTRLRLALHRAIDRMPEEELARLVIPVGYLIED